VREETQQNLEEPKCKKQQPSPIHSEPPEDSQNTKALYNETSTKWGRKPAKIVREEEATREIARGTQQMLESTLTKGGKNKSLSKSNQAQGR